VPGSDDTFCHCITEAGHQYHFSHEPLNFGRN
jgi:hypothetical protein